MPLRPPGRRSDLQLLIYGSITLVELLIFIAGNTLLAWLLLGRLGITGGMQDAIDHTGLPAWSLWLFLLLTVLFDCWIAFYRWMERRRSLKR